MGWTDGWISRAFVRGLTVFTVTFLESSSLIVSFFVLLSFFFGDDGAHVYAASHAKVFTATIQEMNWVSVGALLSWTVFDVGGGPGGIFTFLDDDGQRVERNGRARGVISGSPVDSL